MQLLVQSAARAASGDSGPLNSHFELNSAAAFLLDVTAAGSLAGDLLDVYIQSSIDEGNSWDDFVHFTQVVGNGGTKKYLAFWSLFGGTPTTPMKVPQDGALAVGVQQGPIGPTWRVKWVIANGGGTHSFTFSVGVQQIDQ